MKNTREFPEVLQIGYVIEEPAAARIYRYYVEQKNTVFFMSVDCFQSLYSIKKREDSNIV